MRPDYNGQFHDYVTHFVDDLKMQFKEFNLENDIYMSDLQLALKRLKTGKACGLDGIYTEHLKYGGDTLHEFLLSLFNLMYTHSYIPLGLKRGLIITLYKGGNKRKDDPSSYRAITLSSSILKLYEGILLIRLKKEVNISIHELQGGFQEGLGCNMTTYLTNDCLNYCKETGSKLYACYLDTRQAFDRVWHDGMFYKLFRFGISPQLWLTIVELHTGMSSCVLHKGYLSKWLYIKQGTRQGGLCSPFLYLLYINDLIVELVNSTYGLSIYKKSLCAPTVADDMLLLSLTVNGLQELMNTCFAYSCRWRFEYNPLKCSIIVYNEGKKSCKDRKWFLGKQLIPEADSYVHLGVLSKKYNSTRKQADVFSSTLRKTVFGVSCMTSEFNLNPLTLKKMYTSVVLPKALYGSEWIFKPSSYGYSRLEHAHRLCLKHIQRLAMRTRTDIALGMMSALPIKAEIDLRKLTLFGQMCRLNSKCASKQLFMLRGCQQYLFQSSTGYFTDIVHILTSYGLHEYFNDFISNGFFPNKSAWKKTIRSRIWDVTKRDWYHRLGENSLIRFKSIQCTYNVSAVWLFAIRKPHCLKFCFSVAKLIAHTATFMSVCKQCGEETDSCITDHVIYECCKTNGIRGNMLDKIHSVYGEAVYKLLVELDKTTLINVLLGVKYPTIVNTLGDTLYDNMLTVIFKYLHYLWLNYNMS